MDIVHRTIQGMELCTSLVTLLKFPLEATGDMVESKAAPARPMLTRPWGRIVGQG